MRKQKLPWPFDLRASLRPERLAQHPRLSMLMWELSEVADARFAKLTGES